MTTFLLVAGSFHGGWSWARVMRELREHGHEPYTLSLTGLGERRGLTSRNGIGLQTHVDDVLALVEAEELADVVLVGHSYAGMVVGSVADRAPDTFRRVVYLDAFLPEDGTSAVDLMEPAFADYMLARASGDMVALDTASLDRWGLTDPEDRDWVCRRASPHPLATFTDPARLRRPIGQHGPSVSYVYCTVKPGPDMFGGFAARARNEAHWTYTELNAPHDCMITHPIETAGMLTWLAAL
jgi:pimeloyl-ACP methyl ester carboxylesterase